MKIVPVQESIGKVLCHDITRIVPGQFKGPAFRKGRVIEPEDIPKLLDLGKEHLYVMDLQPGQVHEDEAALRIAHAAAGPGIAFTEPSEGRVNLKSTIKGLLSINVEGLHQINAIEEIVLSSRHTHQVVDAGLAVAGTRIIPLITADEKIRDVEAVCQKFYPIIDVKPLRPFRVGLVTTGSEIYKGRIKDKFGPVLRKKFSQLGSEVFRQILVSDDKAMTVAAIHELLDQGADMIAVTGGMSVDPDDQTPSAIREAGGTVTVYGVPVFPGAMFMLAHIGNVPVVGLPGCVMYYRASIFDLTVPRILAGETVTRDDLVRLGHGGFCAGCEDCRYPVCPLGKG